MRRAPRRGRASGASARRRASSSADARGEEAPRPAEQHDAGVDALAALDLRDDAHDRVLERASAAGAPPRPRRRSARGASQPAAQVLGVRARAPRGANQSSGTASSTSLDQPPRRSRGASRASAASDRRRRRAAARGRGSPGTGAPRARRRVRQACWRYSAAPWSISHSRPCQTSRFGFCGERSTFVTSASSQTISAASSGSGRGAGGRVVGERAGQEVEPDVQPAARARSGPGSPGRARRRRAAGRARRRRSRAPAARAARASSPATSSATSAFGALAGAAELEHVEAVVVGLDQPGHRAALAQRRHVARGVDGPHRRRL